MLPVGFEPTIPTSERPQTHAFDRTVTGIGSVFNLRSLLLTWCIWAIFGLIIQICSLSRVIYSYIMLQFNSHGVAPADSRLNFAVHSPLNHNNQKEISYFNIYPTRCNITQFILSENCSTCFGWQHHPSSGTQTTVSTASGICYTVTAVYRYLGRV